MPSLSLAVSFFSELQRTKQQISAMVRTRSSRADSSPVFGDDPESVMRVIRRARRLAAGPTWTHEADKAAPQAGEGPATVKKNEKVSDGGGSDFDCNVCLELAKEPVVTGCGHLFCWPCLYRWLYVHCDRRGRECPVCKGKVSEDSDVVPIYGRGSSNGEDDVRRGLSVPPRPRGNRVESLRREFEVFRGIPRVARSPRPARTIQSEPPDEDGRAWQQQNRRLRSDPATMGEAAEAEASSIVAMIEGELSFYGS